MAMMTLRTEWQAQAGLKEPNHRRKAGGSASPAGAVTGAQNKRPRGVSTGALTFSFLSKEVTANSVAGNRSFFVVGSGSFILVIVFLLASKSSTVSEGARLSQLHFAWANS
jgi:hypothetical protein